MKKLTIGVIALLIIVSIFFNIKFNNDLKSSNVLKNTIQAELVESEKVKQSLKEDIKTLENKLGDSNKKVSTAEEKLIFSEEELKSTKELIQLIDDKIEGNGETIVKVDELLAENENLKRQIAKLTTIIDEIAAQSLLGKEETEIPEPIEEETIVIENVPIEQWISDIQEIIEYIENRKTELENASSTLPVLSLERLLINQEIEFLDESISDLKALEESLNTFN